jgi:hypothetical protein
MCIFIDFYIIQIRNLRPCDFEGKVVIVTTLKQTLMSTIQNALDGERGRVRIYVQKAVNEALDERAEEELDKLDDMYQTVWLRYNSWDIGIKEFVNAYIWYITNVFDNETLWSQHLRSCLTRLAAE